MTDFGKDISCTTGLRSGQYATGVRLVAEAAFRRLTTPRGMLRGGDDEANYGLDLTELVGSVVTDSSVGALEAQVRNELLKDERIATVDLTTTRVTEGPSTSLILYIKADTSEGPFDLQMGVSAFSVSLIGIDTETA